MNPIQISNGSKIHNGIVQAIAIAGILNAAIPDLAALTHIPGWVSAILALVVKIGNEFLDDKPANPTA